MSFIRWIRNTRRATQRLGYCKPSVGLTTEPRSRGDARDLLRSVVEQPFEVEAAPSFEAWLSSLRGDLVAHSSTGTLVTQAQLFYLFLYRSRSGWLSPKGAEEYVEVLPRQLGLLDEAFRPTEWGHVFGAELVKAAERASWITPAPAVNPFELSRAQSYFLAYMLINADGDFLVPWLGAVVAQVGSQPFDLLELGHSVVVTLLEVGERFSASAYLDADRRRLRGVATAAEGINRELLRGTDSPTADDGVRGQNRLRHLALPRLEWLVDLGLLAKLDPDETRYEFTPTGSRVVQSLTSAYENALAAGYPEEAVQAVLDRNYAKSFKELLGYEAGPPTAPFGGTEVVRYLLPSYRALNSISGYCLLRPLVIVAAALAEGPAAAPVHEYADVLESVEQVYKSAPGVLHYTVDRLSTDVQIKFTGGGRY